MSRTEHLESEVAPKHSDSPVERRHHAQPSISPSRLFTGAFFIYHVDSHRTSHADNPEHTHIPGSTLLKPHYSYRMLRQHTTLTRNSRKTKRQDTKHKNMKTKKNNKKTTPTATAAIKRANYNVKATTQKPHSTTLRLIYIATQSKDRRTPNAPFSATLIKIVPV